MRCCREGKSVRILRYLLLRSGVYYSCCAKASKLILVVAAVIAYLAKQGYKRMLKYIYLGVVGGLIASAIMAALLTSIFKAAGSHQEVFEGVTALIAMVMLLYTSNWMLSKTDHEAWSAYVRREDEAKHFQWFGYVSGYFVVLGCIP